MVWRKFTFFQTSFSITITARVSGKTACLFAGALMLKDRLKIIRKGQKLFFLWAGKRKSERWVANGLGRRRQLGCSGSMELFHPQSGTCAHQRPTRATNGLLSRSSLYARRTLVFPSWEEYSWQGIRKWGLNGKRGLKQRRKSHHKNYLQAINPVVNFKPSKPFFYL